MVGSHLHLTGTIAHSFLSSTKALSTTFLSSPVSSATLPALIGSQAFFMASNTISFSFMYAEMVVNTPPIWPTGWKWWKKIELWSTDILSILQNNKVVDDPQRVRNFAYEISSCINRRCVEDPIYMKDATKEKLISDLEEELMKNFRKMTKSTAKKKIEKAVNEFMIKRMKIKKMMKIYNYPAWWDDFIEAIEAVRSGVSAEGMSELLNKIWNRHNIKLTKSELENIATDKLKAKKIMRHLNWYVLNLDLAKALAMVWLLHDEDNYPSIRIGSDSHILMSPSYFRFRIEKEDLDFLCEKSAEIESVHSSFSLGKREKIIEIRDEIDEYFDNKKNQ